MDLNKAQVKYLRKLSHEEKPLFQMGKQGLSDAFIEQIDLALNKRELIKFNILQNSEEDLDEVTETISNATNAFIVQLIGHTAILYRPSSQEKNRKISLEVNAIK